MITNEASGTAGGERDALEGALARTGLDVRIERVSGAGIAGAAGRAAADCGVLVAAGGDGTVSSVAAVAVRTGVTLGIVPLGTLNHFARDAGIPLAMDEAVEAIAAGHTTLVDVSDVNGRAFVNNVSLGAYPRLVSERRREQDHGRAKWTAFAIALLRTWLHHRLAIVRMTIDGAPIVRRTPFVFVGNGPYQTEGLGLGRRASLDTGRLSVHVAPECGRFDMLGLTLRALAGRLTPDAKLESFSATAVTIDMRRSSVSVAVDGELMKVRLPLRCTVRPRALRLIVPASR